jgi:hypothetical protein
MPQPVKDQIAAILTNEDTLATTLLLLCIDQLGGTDFFEWEPATFDMEVQTRFGTQMPDVNRDKLWALVTALTTNLFYVSLETFIPTCNTLNGSEADFDDYDPITSEEAAWGIVEVSLVDPPDEDQAPGDRFSHEIKRYIALTLQAEGVTTPPAILKPFAEYNQEPEEEAGITSGPDEAMLNMHMDRQAAERADIEDYVRGRLEDLMTQLKMLPLRIGKVSQMEQFLQQAQATLTGLPTPEAAVLAP